jgi:4-aminobutyrate aminotransferase-like enzyme
MLYAFFSTVIGFTTGSHGCVVRLSPPLVIGESDISDFLRIFAESVKAVEA